MPRAEFEQSKNMRPMKSDIHAGIPKLCVRFHDMRTVYHALYFTVACGLGRAVNNVYNHLGLGN
jgi:hypothetical protein